MELSKENLKETQLQEQYKVFISSTIKDKVILRKEIQKRLSSQKLLQPILSEDPTTFPKSIERVDTFKASINAVKQADIFLLIIGKRYGEIHPSSDISIMESEYHEARRREIPCIIFIDQEVRTQHDTYNELKKAKKETTD